MQSHEDALRNECGYTGYQPYVSMFLPIKNPCLHEWIPRYWQEQIDAGKFSQSVIFDNTYGFGGDGSGHGNCITTGPFVNYTNSIGPGYQLTNHCIDRKISNQMSAGSSQSNVNQCLQQSTFATAWSCIEASPHAGGHAGVGGQVNAEYILHNPGAKWISDAKRSIKPRGSTVLPTSHLVGQDLGRLASR